MDTAIKITLKHNDRSVGQLSGNVPHTFAMQIAGGLHALILHVNENQGGKIGGMTPKNVSVNMSGPWRDNGNAKVPTSVDCCIEVI
jgi:hypothetical protein